MRGWLSVRGSFGPAALDALRAGAAAFLAGTSLVPDDRDLHARLVVTDGVRTWEP